MEPGQTFAAYRLVERLEAWDDHEIWLACANWVDGDNRPVVVEALRRDHERSDAFLEQAWNLARLNHPTIAQVFDVGTVDGWSFLARQNIMAPSLLDLHERCGERGGRLPVWFVLRVAEEICEGLDYIRRHVSACGHQHVGPQTVAVLHWGQSKLVALGHHHSAGPCAGLGRCTCDVRSLGATLHDLLGPAPSSVPPELDRIVRRSMAEADVASIDEPGELQAALAGSLSRMNDRHGQTEVGMFVSSLFPDFHRGVAQRSDSLFWEQLNNFIITEGEDRRTEDKLERSRPVEQGWTSELRRLARGSSWIMRLMGSQVDSRLKERSRQTRTVAALTQQETEDRPDPGSLASPWDRGAGAKPTPEHRSRSDRVAEIWSTASTKSAGVPKRDMWSTPTPTSDISDIWDRPRREAAAKDPAQGIWDRRPEAPAEEQLDSRMDIWDRPPVAPVRREGEPAPVADIWEQRPVAPRTGDGDIRDVWERAARTPVDPPDPPDEPEPASVWDARPTRQSAELEKLGTPDVYTRHLPRERREGDDVFASVRPKAQRPENPFAAPDGRRRKR